MTEDVKQKNKFSAYIVKQFRNRNVFIFLFFLVLSSFLWFLNYINKEHSSDIKVPYKFENLPNKAKLNADNESNLTVLIHGHGYNILRELIETVKLPVIINLAEKEIPIVFHACVNNPLKSYILTQDLIPFLERRFGANIQIIGVKPDTLFFDMAESYSKKVPVVFNGDFVINQGFLISGKEILNPDSVLVFGPKHIIDTIRSVYCEDIKIEDVGESHIKEVKLIRIRDLNFSKSKILINFPVEKYTETSIDLPVIASNFPDSLDYQLLPGRVNIFYKVPLSLYDKIDSLNFEVVADYKTEKNNQITVNVVSVNPYLEITKVNPFSISFVLKRKANND